MHRKLINIVINLVNKNKQCEYCDSKTCVAYNNIFGYVCGKCYGEFYESIYKDRQFHRAANQNKTKPFKPLGEDDRSC